MPMLRDPLKLGRWNLDRTVARMFPASDGSWVKADEHFAKVKVLEARIAELEVLLSQTGLGGNSSGGSLTTCDMDEDERS